MLSPNSKVVASRDQVSCHLGAEAAILHVGSGVYYGLNPVGARVWSLLQQPVVVQRLRETLLAEYNVEPDRLERDLTDLLDRLAAEGLIAVLDEPVP
jgi:Coenzyme PQQ synthesis protein D (PqqD)